MSSSAAAELARQLARARSLHDERAASPALAAELDRLAAWQTRRIDTSYADLARQPRYAPAIAFFQTDLYGAGDFSRRDADLARVVPLMSRVLPEGVITTVAKAMELSVLSHELDRRMVARLDPGAPLTAESYGQVFRALGNRGERMRQIALIGEVGRSLDRYVHKPMLFSTLVAMRRPARAAGMGELQAFLERGFTAFRAMHGADEFLATIDARETALMDALFAGGSPVPPAP